MWCYIPVSCGYVHDEHGFAGWVALAGQGPAETALNGDFRLVPAMKKFVNS